MAKIDIIKTELVWPGKYDENGNLKEVEKIVVPFQVIESINSSRADREKRKEVGRSLYEFYDTKEGSTVETGWKNKLIWGDNKLVMSSLLKQFAGKVDLCYIDPPFATGADFSYTTEVGETDEEVLKEQSIIEEKAYRDTWGKNLDTYLAMIRERLLIVRDLLSSEGTLWVHLDDYAGHYVKILLDEIFGRDCFLNQIIWYYPDNFQGNLNRYADNHNFILVYGKESKIKLNRVKIPLDKPVMRDKRIWDKELQRIVAARDKSGNIIYEEYTDKYADNVWTIGQSSVSKRKSGEYLGYPTQKPIALLKRVLNSSTKKDPLIADFFCGSGTTCAVAEKLGMRWIGCDLSRWAIHTTRKRLMEIENCKPFEILNLGRYERQYWQGVTFGGKKSQQEVAVYQYIAFILKLYGAEPLTGMKYLHGKKGDSIIHIGSVDSPITIDEINVCIDECLALKQKNLHILGWEWEMGLYDIIVKEAKGRGVNLTLLNIPREVMEKQAVDQGHVKFFELAYLDIEIKIVATKKVKITLKDFAMSNMDLIPDEVREKVKKWSDYIDYWAIDWNFQNDTFINGYVNYRTNRDRTLQLTSDTYEYLAPGTYTIMVKVVDIFGNDTSKAYEIKVK